MVTTDIIPATPEHAAYIVAHVRPEDKAELWAACYATPEKAMKEGIALGDFTRTGLVNGEPVCMWGVVTDDFIFSLGVPWMVGSVALDRHAKVFLRRCRAPLLEMLRGYDRLENYVDARNTRSVNWLKFLGFTMEAAVPFGVLGLPFHKFWRCGNV